MADYSILPPRYQTRWRNAFDQRYRADLRPGLRVLDLGSGRTPAVPHDERPHGMRYDGLDISERELRLAPAGSYDQTIVGDISDSALPVSDAYDLILSWQVLEHVRRMEVALANVRRLLAPGGRFLAMLSSAYSAFGLINKIVPQRLGVLAMERLLKRPPESVFPAYYDRCTYTGLTTLLRNWSKVEITPIYAAAAYFSFARPLQRAYVVYEDWAVRTKRSNLATHYIIDAIR